MKFLLFIFLGLIALVFFAMVAGAGMIYSLFNRMRGPRQHARASEVNAALASMTPGERAVLARCVQAGDPAVLDFSDQPSLDGLVAKNIIAQITEPGGLIGYRVHDTVWSLLRVNHRAFP